MTATEAQETVAIIGEGLSDRLVELVNSIHELEERRAQLLQLWTDCDYQALRDCGFLSQRELDRYQAACAVIESNE